MAPPPDTATIRRYLLGALSEPEVTALEDRYFVDAEAFDQVWAAEYELVDDYVAGRLGAEDRALFERNFLGSPDHRERVATARALRRASVEAEGRPAATAARISHRVASRAGAWWLAAAALSAAATAGWLLYRQPPVATSALETPRPETPSPSPGRHTPAASPSPVPVGPALRSPVAVAFALSPILLRGSKEQPQLRIPRGTEQVVLHLKGKPVASPRLLTFVVRTVEGDVVASGAAERSRKLPIASVRLPAKRLPADDYILVLSAAGDDEPLHQYFFRVVEP